MFYLNSILNFGIAPVLVFQLEVCYQENRLLTGLTAQQKGITSRWYSNKTYLVLFYCASKMVALCKKFRNLKTISDLIYLVFCLKKSKEKLSGDDKFIYWLRDCREAGLQVSLSQVKAKVSEILSSHGQADVEKTCKWFLLWHNR